MTENDEGNSQKMSELTISKVGSRTLNWGINNVDLKNIQINLVFYSICTIFATKMNKRVLDSIRKLLAQTLPPNATARLYGSQARGDAHRGSDWDILIVMDKDRLLPDDYDTITYPLTKLGWELGTEINPIMYTKKEWEQSKITPFYHNVEQDAIAL